MNHGKIPWIQRVDNGQMSFLLRQAAATPGCNAIKGARCGLEAPLARALVTW